MKKYKLVVSGGTFDRLHTGHKDFLSHQLAVSEAVILGITSDTFAGKKDEGIESFSKRKQVVEAFLHEKNALSRVKIMQIDHAGLPDEVSGLPIDAIVVTEATREGAQLINDERRKAGLPVLKIELSPMTPADDGVPISSTRIREGTIDRDGALYAPESIVTRSFTLPDALRDTLKEPFGDLITDPEFDYNSSDMAQTVTVGDIATKTLLERGLVPGIAIVDLIVERKKQYLKHSDIGFLGDETVLHADNPPGSITPALFAAVREAFAKKTERPVVIVVNGEEDLAVLPVLLYSPLGYAIYYGQPGQGIVKVRVDEEKKALARALIEKLEIVEN